MAAFDASGYLHQDDTKPSLQLQVDRPKTSPWTRIATAIVVAGIVAVGALVYFQGASKEKAAHIPVVTVQPSESGQNSVPALSPDSTVIGRKKSTSSFMSTNKKKLENGRNVALDGTVKNDINESASLAKKTETEVVEVDPNNSVVLNTTDATIGTNFDMHMVHELPIKSEDSPASLLLLHPNPSIVSISMAATNTQPEWVHTLKDAIAKPSETTDTLDVSTEGVLLTIQGFNFASSSIVKLNEKGIHTKFINATELIAYVPVTDELRGSVLAGKGEMQVMVVNIFSADSEVSDTEEAPAIEVASEPIGINIQFLTSH